MAPKRPRSQWSAEWRTYRRLIAWVAPYKWRLAVGVLSGMLFALANLGFVWVVKGGVREVFHPGDESGPFLLLVALLFPLVAILRGAADFLATYLINWVGHRVVSDLRDALFDHLHGLSVDYFSNSRTGEIISRTTNDTMAIERAVAAVLADLAKQPLTLVAMVVSVFAVDAQLAAVSVVLFPLCVVPIAVFGRRVRRYSRQAQERIADVVSILQETVAGVRIVKAFGMEAYESARFREQTRAFFGRIMRVARANALLEPIVVTIAAVGVSLLLGYVRAVRMPIDQFFAFITAYFMMYEPVKKLSKIHVHIQQSSASADRIFEILDTPGTVKDAPDARLLEPPVTGIEFERVRFGYEDAVVIDEVNLRVAPGEKVALVGGSGAGKTTLVNLLPRFYDVTGGCIRINGVDVRQWTQASLRRQIGLVTQDTFLFNDTVANNIAYGSTGCARAKIEEAARRAHAHDFILRMPAGYDTVIGERGVRLSGGERQRLSIARAILRDPPILILDEATSALDSESERMVQQALDELIAGRTVFAIAHRLSTIANCNRIVVLDRGRVIEEGTHAELIARAGAYKRLYDMQFEARA